MTPNRIITNPAARRWLYGVATAALACLAVWGLLNAEQVAALTGLAAAITGLAAANVPTEGTEG